MIQSLERGMQALDFLTKRKNAGVTEIAGGAGRQQKHRFSDSRNADGIQHGGAGSRVCEIQAGAGNSPVIRSPSENLNIVSAAKPVMARLVEETGESSHLCMLSNDSAVVIEQIMTDSRLTVHARIGNAEPIYCSSVGKCLLAFSEDAKRENLLSQIKFERFTKNTITDPESLKAQLRDIVEKGYALDDGEISEGHHVHRGRRSITTRAACSIAWAFQGPRAD